MAAPEPDPAVVAAEKDQVFDLRQAGRTFREISKIIGRPLSTVHKRWDDSINEARRHKVDEYIVLTLERYEDLIRRLTDRMDTGGEHPEKISPELVRVLMGERALLGLDAPKRVDVRTAGPSADFSGVRDLAGPDPEADWDGTAGQDEAGG